MLNMMPLSRHALSLQTGLHRQFILGTVIPPTPHHPTPSTPSNIECDSFSWNPFQRATTIPHLPTVHEAVTPGFSYMTYPGKSNTWATGEADFVSEKIAAIGQW